MRKSLGTAALAAVLLGPAAASATPITVGESGSLVIDVEFWGRRQFTSPDLDNPGGEDITSYGDPVRGTFRIWTDDAPTPTRTSTIEDITQAAIYGRDTRPVGDVAPASFVTSRWLSPFPEGSHDVSAFPGSIADDHVVIGDGVRFTPAKPHDDWFQVSDAFSERVDEQTVPSSNELYITVTTPLDIIHGVGLEQEFELTTPVETSDAGVGFFRTVVNGAVRSIAFAVERLSVSKQRVCRP